MTDYGVEKMEWDFEKVVDMTIAQAPIPERVMVEVHGGTQMFLQELRGRAQGLRDAFK